MITFEEAIEIALKDLREDLTVNPDAVIEKPYGWVFFPDSKKYFETGDMQYMTVGSGGNLILKENGKKIEFGSLFSIEKNLEIYELGYLDHDNWDIVITKVMDERNGIDKIWRLDASYVIPELKHGVVWRIPQNYTRKQIENMARKPPFRLNLGKIYFNYEYIESLKNQNYFEYYLEPNSGYENGI